MCPPKDSDGQKMGKLSAPSTPAGFPDLHDASLSQSSEDQQALMRIQGSWNEHGDTWSSDMKEKILRHLPDVRTTEINKDTPSKHKLYSVEFDFASWVLLRCIYPDQKLPVLKALLVAKHPDINPYSFAGPDLTKMRETAKKSWHKQDDAVSGSSNIAKSGPRLVTDEKPGATGPPRWKPSNNPVLPYPRPLMHYVYDVEFCVGKLMLRTRSGTFMYVESLKSKLGKAIKKCTRTSYKNPEGMAVGHAASEKNPMLDFKFLESSEFAPSVNDSAPGLSDEQFEELKAYICKMAATANYRLGGKMDNMHAWTESKIKDMETKIKNESAESGKQLSVLASEVSELRAMIKAVHREKKVMDELEGRIISLEKCIMSL